MVVPYDGVGRRYAPSNGVPAPVGREARLSRLYGRRVVSHVPGRTTSRMAEDRRVRKPAFRAPGVVGEHAMYRTGPGSGAAPLPGRSSGL